MIKLKAREGDFLLTTDKLFFDVKGYVHPPDRIISFIRYYPSRKGERVLNGEKYKRIYDLKKRFKLLKRKYPVYIYYDDVFHSIMQSVPINMVKKLYEPKEKVKELMTEKNKSKIEDEALNLIQILTKEANQEINRFGVTGSILINLFTKHSDLDVVVYGIKASKKVYEALKKLIQERKDFNSYSKNELYEIYLARGMEKTVNFKDFYENEKTKVLQGKFHEKNYFIRCVKDWNEVKEFYGDKIYYPIGLSKIKATVIDNEESILTPCKYEVSNVKILSGKKALIKEIVSFRGRFCEMA
ncbi:MAG: nucleotidyltransferase domain-containing protein, partial [Candidatus Bathyarchaeia archaeon]